MTDRCRPRRRRARRARTRIGALPSEAVSLYNAGRSGRSFLTVTGGPDMKKHSTLAALAPLFVGQPVAAADPTMAPPPAGLVAADVRPGQAATVCFLEGPAVHVSGDVYFSDISG